MGKRKQKRGKAAKNARKGISSVEPEELVKAPHSFVINQGRLGKNCHELMLNFRKIMEPFTASRLKVKKSNVIRDFIHIAGPLNVTELIVFTKSENAMHLKIAKLPRGPTLTFQIKDYALMKDVISSQRKPMIYEKLFSYHPLVILNNFSGDSMHIRLIATTFQHIFPSINVNKINLNKIRRCVFINYTDDSEETLELRQYAIKVVPTGCSKAVKKLIQAKIPNLNKYQNIEQFIKKYDTSESEGESEAANTVLLPQPISSRGNIASGKSGIQLKEIGPRMTLKLTKVEDGVMRGELLKQEKSSRLPSNNEKAYGLNDTLKA